MFLQISSQIGTVYVRDWHVWVFHFLWPNSAFWATQLKQSRCSVTGRGPVTEPDRYGSKCKLWNQSNHITCFSTFVWGQVNSIAGLPHWHFLGNYIKWDPLQIPTTGMGLTVHHWISVCFSACFSKSGLQGRWGINMYCVLWTLPFTCDTQSTTEHLARLRDSSFLGGYKHFFCSVSTQHSPEPEILQVEHVCPAK